MAAAALVCSVECVCVLLSPGRAGQTGPVHMEPAPLVSFVVALGVFPIGVWSVQYHAASSHSTSNSSRIAVSLSPLCLSLIHFFSALTLFCFQLQNNLHISIIHGHSVSLIYFSQSHSLYPLSTWPLCPSLSVCIHHLSGWIWLAFINRAL